MLNLHHIGVWSAAAIVVVCSAASASDKRDQEQRAAVEGVIRRVRVTREAAEVRLSTLESSVTMRVPVSGGARMRKLIDSALRAAGTWNAGRGSRRELIVADVRDVALVRAGADPFQLPVSRLRALKQPDAAQRLPHRVRVQVVVTAPRNGGTFFVREGAEGLAVRTDQMEAVRPGDRLDVVGFPTRGENGLVLRDAEFRRLGHAGEPAPVEVMPSQILTGAYAGALVRVEGQVVRYVRGRNRYEIVLKSDGTLFQAIVPVGSEIEDRIVLESRVAITGIVNARFDARGAVASFTVAARHPDDLVALAFPRWWNIQHVLWLLGVCAIGLVSAAGWIRALRRRLPRAERALSDSEARYGAIFEYSPGGNYVTGVRDEIVACNTTFATLLGFGAPSEAVGRPLATLYSNGADRVKIIEALRSASPRHTHELTMVRVDRQAVRVQESIVAVFDDAGRRTALHGFLLDVTEQRRAQAALEERDAELRQAQKMEAIGRLAGGVAHDFNNLLTAILGYSELASTETDVPTIHENVQEILKAANSAAGLTRQLLAFSRKTVLEPRIVNLNAHVERMACLLRHTLGETIQLRLQSCARPPIVFADPVQLEQVILNLAVNARDAMPGGGLLTMSTRMNHTHVVLEVSDTGPGIPDDVLPHIFEPFFTTKGEGKGTGLGLATVYGIVKSIGGDVRVRNNATSGCRFIIRLPVMADTPADVAADAPPAETGAETVLLVEDEGSVRSLAQMLLERRGYHVMAANDAAHALKIAAESDRPIDLLLTDVVMPVMNGLNLAAHLCAARPELKVLFMSGYADQRRLESDVRHAFVPKPFTAKTLSHAVRSALDAPLGAVRTLS